MLEERFYFKCCLPVPAGDGLYQHRTCRIGNEKVFLISFFTHIWALYFWTDWSLFLDEWISPQVHEPAEKRKQSIFSS